MATLESLNEYRHLQKLAKKVFIKRKVKRLNPYIDSLEEKVDVNECSVIVLGLIDVPSDLIVGTKTIARKNSFAHGFLPLLGETSEFASKWIQVCNLHMSDKGISDAPEAIEYLGKFYIVEGNKRVSVLKSFGAPYITLNVKRLIPKDINSFTCLSYKEFLAYYELSKLYSIQFIKADYYQKFIRLLGFSKDYVWTRQDRYKVIGLFERVKYFLNKFEIEYNSADCFYSLIELYGFNEIEAFKDSELEKAIKENITGLRFGLGIINITCVSDEENRYLSSDLAKKKLEGTEFIISAGDLKASYLEYLTSVSNKDLFYVHGNHDDHYDSNPPEGCVCIDDDLVIYKGIRILGLGGSYKYSDRKYQYSESEMKRRIRRIKWKIRKAKGVDIIVTHAPIKGYGDLNDYAHQGFECFKELLEKYEPKYWLYGHVHSNYDVKNSRIFSYKKTLIINVSDYYQLKY